MTSICFLYKWHIRYKYYFSCVASNMVSMRGKCVWNVSQVDLSTGTKWQSILWHSTTRGSVPSTGHLFLLLPWNVWASHEGEVCGRGRHPEFTVGNPCWKTASWKTKQVMKGKNVGWDSVVGIGTCYRLDRPGIEYGGSENFRTRPDRRWGPPNLLWNGYRVCFRVVKRQGLGVDLPHPASVELKERVKLYFCSSLEFHGLFEGEFWPEGKK